MKCLQSFLQIVVVLFFLASCDTGSEQADTASSDTSSPADTSQAEASEKKTILFFGNSLTAGYGLDDPADAFPGIIQEKLDSLGYDFEVVNAGLSGETTASGKNRLDWVLDRHTVDIFVLELGANDGLRGISPEETRKNLEAMIDQVRATYPEAQILLAGMMVPPNMGQAYSDQFQNIFPEVAQRKDVALVPFLLQDVAGETSLNQADGIHPTEEGNLLVAENVWDVLKNMLPAASS